MKNNRGKLASPRGWLSRLVRFLTPRRRNMVEMTSPRLGQLLDVSRELDRKQKLNPSCEVTKDGKHIWKHGHDFARAAKCRACDKWYDL